jgi:hypothetical protein
MANEITINLRLLVENGFLVHKEEPGTQSITMTGKRGCGGIQNIGTSAEAVAVGDTGTAGWAFFRNTATANYVEVGVLVSATFYPFVKLKAGESCILRLGTNAPYALANTAAVDLQYYILSD